MPLPTWADVKTFCETQQYERLRTTDHARYLKRLPDGSTSGTKISFGKESVTVPRELWTRVWRRQLRLVAEDEFWRGLRGQPVTYAIPPEPALEPSQPLPDYLQRFLRDALHWDAARIDSVTRGDAQALLNAHYAQQLNEP